MNDKWIAYPMHEIGTRGFATSRVNSVSQPTTFLKKERMWVWATILVWLFFVAMLLSLLNLNEAEGAEVSFTKTMMLIEVDGNVQMAFLALDDQAKQTAITSNCDLSTMSRKMVVFDFTEPSLPTLRISYLCSTKKVDAKKEEKKEPVPY